MLALVLALCGIPGISGPGAETFGTAKVYAKTPAPTKVKVTITKKNSQKVKVKVSWNGSAPRYLVIVEGYCAGSRAEKWLYVAKKNASFEFEQEEGIPYKYYAHVFGHNGGDRSDDNTYSKDVIKKKSYQLVGKYTKKIQNIIKRNGVRKRSKFKQIKFVHDWIVKNFSYDESKKESNFTFPGTFKNKKGVCEGYAKTFSVFMTCLKIPVEYVSNQSHGWNMVKLSGKWYHVDCTYDDPMGALEKYTKKHPVYDYFMQSTKSIKKKLGSGMHRFSEKDYPKAKSTTYDNAGGTSGYSEEIPGSEGAFSTSTFTPWKNGRAMN